MPVIHLSSLSKNARLASSSVRSLTAISRRLQTRKHDAAAAALKLLTKPRLERRGFFFGYGCTIRRKKHSLRR
jgi:hypothetical protein